MRAPKQFKLSSHYWAKRPFNPSNPTDLKEFQYFLDNARWNHGCPFVLEWPFVTIPDMIRYKLVQTYLDDLIVQATKAEKHHVKRATATKAKATKPKSAGTSRTVRRGQSVQA